MDIVQKLSHNDGKSPKVSIENTEQRSIRAQFIDQEYRLQIYLPPTYSDSSDSFPVLYLLDSDKSFGMAKDIVEWLNWSQEIPELIIVGIAYGEGTQQWWQKRSRDYTPSKDRTKIWGDWPMAGGGANFLKFIKQELIPFVDTHYRTQGSDMAITGLSFGGLFAAYALLTEPELFNRYIMISPAFIWDDRMLFKCLDEYSKNRDTLNARVYSVVGELDERENIIKPWQEFFAILENRNFQGLRLTKEIIAGETHISVYPAGFTRGLKYVFSGTEIHSR
ncbi:MAG: alpha/beta hydrolase-fold protein [Anaerolineales bacterium]|nr:alpha/beta hydrolase-fold protein [Anaerolineales bacterium]